MSKQEQLDKVKDVLANIAGVARPGIGAGAFDASEACKKVVALCELAIAVASVP